MDEQTLLKIREALRVGLGRCEATQGAYRASKFYSSRLDEGIRQIEQAIASIDMYLNGGGGFR